MCNYCGKSEHYAKGYCRNCYLRFSRKGVADYTHKAQTGIKLIYTYLNTIINDWKIINITHPKTNSSMYCVTKECVFCGNIYEFTVAGMALTTTNSIKKICGCRYTYKPRTEAQSKIYKSFIENKYNYTHTANILGLSKQRVEQVIKSIRE